jgi:hypothetical protein
MAKKLNSKPKKRKPFQRETPEELLQQDFTGDCYRAAVSWASATKGQGWNVVHGTVRSFEKGRLQHAWCERGEEVIDLAMPVGMRQFTREEYYRVLEPDVAKRYPDENAVLLSIRYHYGPWEDDEQLPEWLLTELEKKRNGSAKSQESAAG